VAKFKKIARLACQGGKSMLKVPRKLEGAKSCVEANEIDDGACKYGCLGLGTCVEACKFDAMKINDDGIVEIDEEKCTGCGICARKCPRNLITIVDRKNTVYVRCNAEGKGKDKSLLCKTACIGCTVCEQRCPFDAIKVENGLAKINYEKCRSCGYCAGVCPSLLAYSKVIVNTAKPEDRLIAVIDEEKCIGCTLCKRACPQVNAISGNRKEAHKVNPDFCIGCGACIEKCRKEAITLSPLKFPLLQNEN
jgi:electron transport complex protein RnfB